LEQVFKTKKGKGTNPESNSRPSTASTLAKIKNLQVHYNLTPILVSRKGFTYLV
jgi:hypothetical protein